MRPYLPTASDFDMRSRTKPALVIRFGNPVRRSVAGSDGQLRFLADFSEETTIRELKFSLVNGSERSDVYAVTSMERRAKTMVFNSAKVCLMVICKRT